MRAVSVDQEAVVVIFIIADVAADVAAAFDDQNALAKLRHGALGQRTAGQAVEDDEPIYSAWCVLRRTAMFGGYRLRRRRGTLGSSRFLNAAKMLADDSVR